MDMDMDEKFDLIMNALGAANFLDELLDCMSIDEQDEAFDWIIRCWGLNSDDEEEEED